jgi:hypothetical protein
MSRGVRGLIGTEGWGGCPVGGALAHEQVRKDLTGQGRLPWSDGLRRCVRYSCDGAVSGSREFGEDLFGADRQRFGANRSHGRLGFRRGA